MIKIRTVILTRIFILSALGVLIIELFLDSYAQAATYYVSSAGNDSNPGSSNAPFRTIQKAANIVNPGDTVIVRDGIYTDTNGDNFIVYVNRGGNSSNWITFKSENKWGAVLDGENNTAGYGWTFGSNAEYIRVEGFEVKGCEWVGLHVNAANNDIYFYLNKVHDIGRLVSDSPYGKCGAFAGNGTSNITYDSNLFYDNGRLPHNPQQSLDYSNDHGIYISGTTNVNIINNILYNHKSGWAVQFWGGTQTNTNIINNTFAFANLKHPGYILIWHASTINIENNIFYQPNSHAIYIFPNCLGSSNSSVTIKNNISTNDISSLTCDYTFADNMANTDLTCRFNQLRFPDTDELACHSQSSIIGSPDCDHESNRRIGSDIGACESPR